MNREEFIKQMKKNVENDMKIVERKNADYADGGDPFQNFRVVQHLGVTTVEQGIVVRLSDKIQRIANLLKREAQVKDESIIDTLSDARNYLNILQVWLEQKNGQK
jgi:hypothetical protein